MAGRVLSIEVGYSSTKVCEMDYQAKRPKIYCCFSFPTPEGTLSDGMLTVTDKFVEALKGRLSKNKIRTKNVIFTISSSKIATREVKIPYCKENRISDIVRVNLQDYFPIDVSQYMIAHSVLGVEYDDGKSDAKQGKPTGYKLLLLAAPVALLEGYRSLAAALKLEVKEIDYNGNSIFQAAKDECAEGTKLVVKVDERSSMILVQKDGVIVLSRTIPYGIDDTVMTLAETSAWGKVNSYKKALSLAQKEACIFPFFDIKEESLDSSEALDKKTVTMSLASLIGGVSKVIDYYNVNHKDSAIEKIYITGIGADFVGLPDLLSNEIACEVAVLKKITGISAEKTFKNAGFSEYTACIGAVMAPVHFVSEKEETKEKKKKGSGNLRLALIICIGCVLIGIAVILTALIPYLQEQKRKEEYTAIIEELQPVYQVYVEHQSKASQVSLMKELDEQTKNRNKDLVEFIAVLEDKMPTSFCLNDMNATADGIVMNVTVATKEEAAAVLNELRKQEAFVFVDTTALSELITEIGETQYAFSVELIYAPIEAETEGEE